MAVTFAKNILEKIGKLIVVLLVFMGCKAPINRQTDKALPINLAGKQLFESKCASCHGINKEMAGPALQGVLQRWKNIPQLYAFIRNSEIAIKNEGYARNLWLQFNQTTMPPFANLTDADIKAVLNYVQQAGQQ